MRRMIRMILASMLISNIVFCVYAHPGKTDSSGGHTDRSTGEYHYHHGYSAHSHYDMDGDGDVDCPHNFNDLTDHSSGHSSGSSSGYSKPKATLPSIISTQPSTPQPATEPSTAATTKETEKEAPEEMPLSAKWIIAILGFAAICLFFLNRSKKETIDSQDKRIEKLEKERKANQSTINQQAEKIRSQSQLIQSLEKIHESDFSIIHRQKTTIETLTAMARKWRIEADHATRRAEGMVSIREKENAILMDTIRKLQADKHEIFRRIPTLKDAPLDNALPEPIDVPDDVYFVRGNIPVTGEVSEDKPFGDFTVYVTRQGTKYHINRFCTGSYSMMPVHIYDVLEKKSLCGNCAFRSPHWSFREIPSWYKKTKELPEIIKIKETLG